MRILKNIAEQLHDLDAVDVADKYLRILENWHLIISAVDIKLKEK